MITYKLTNHETVLRIDTESDVVWTIPLNSSDWKAIEYREWLAQGNEPEPADEVTE